MSESIDALKEAEVVDGLMLIVLAGWVDIRLEIAGLSYAEEVGMVNSDVASGGIWQAALRVHVHFQ